MRLPALITAPTLLLMVSGCAIALPDSTHSRSYAESGAAPAGGEAQRSHDLDACRRSADRTMGADAAIDPADDHTANPMVLARREQLRGEYQTLVDQCMRDPR